VSIYVSVQRKGTIAIPPKLRQAYNLNRPGAQVEIVEEDGRLVLIPKIAVDGAQAWFWTKEWQEREAEATAQFRAGDGVAYENGEDFLAGLPE
jgi:bifunctional DNA-binding transcriptional regulator/antitoxin component of YhaV-PrlF toxin-antitoxin module